MKTRSGTLASMLGSTTTVFVQDGSLLQQRFAQTGATKKKNQLVLRGYQWRKSVSATVDGHQAPPRQSLCSYAADGTILKTTVGSAGDDSAINGGPLRRHMIAKKEEEVADVGQVTGEYLRPLPDKLRDVAAKDKVALECDSQGDQHLTANTNYVRRAPQWWD